jgi:hypothetical protein
VVAADRSAFETGWRITVTSPLITTAAITSLVSAIIAVLIAFGVGLTEAQVTAIMGLVAVAAPWIVVAVGHVTTTPLNNPVDVDGEKLTRGDGSPAIKAQ